MEIVNFKQQPEYLDEIASHWQEQWGHLNPKKTMQHRKKELQEYLLTKNKNSLPQLWLIREGNELLGTAAIVEDDLPSIQHGHSPWLASVYVKPDFRQQGIGNILVTHIIQQAKEFFDSLTLFTEDKANWYERIGFKPIEKQKYSGYDIDIMQLEFPE